MRFPDDGADLAGRTGCRIRATLTLTIILLLALAFRLGSIGHLLTWDEAMQVCAERSSAAGSGDAFSLWMWRHPPVYSLLLSLFQPRVPGFAERAEAFGIVIGLLNIILLYFLNRRIAGERWGIWSAFFLAVLPGAIFFDVWVKADTLVTALGLLALLMVVHRRPLWAGLALGVGILTKETAVFHVVAAGLLGCLSWRGAERVRGVAVMALVAAATAAWWFILVFPGIGDLTGQFVFAGGAGPVGWGKPWHHYLGLLPGILGWPGMVLAAGGVAALTLLWIASRRAGGTHGDLPPGTVLWPLLLWVPALTGLSLFANKAGWVLISLLPGLAALEGACLCWLVGGVSRWWRDGAEVVRWPGRAWPRVLKVAAVSASLLAAAMLKYDVEMHAIEAGRESGAAASQLIAETLNRAASDGERVLVMPFYYWGGPGDREPCPVFTYYLRRHVDVLMVSTDVSASAIMDSIREYRLHWAVVSPVPGPGANALFGQLVTGGLRPVRLPGAYLYDCRALWQDVSRSAVEAMDEDADAHRHLLHRQTKEGNP